MAKYNLYLRINGKNLELEIKGRVDLSSSQLEALATGAEPAKGKKQLTKERAYKLLEQEKTTEWILERYDVSKQQLAGYKAWMARG